MDHESRRRQVEALRAEGLSFREVGRRLGISHEQARRAVTVTALSQVRPPLELDQRGAAFRSYVESTFDLDRSELELLTQVCRLLDMADRLQRQVDTDGVTVLNARSEQRAHPALVELRQVSLALGRLLAQLEIPGEDEQRTKPVIRSGWSRRGENAARARWGSTIPALREGAGE
ncbi:MAG: hypothetical protein ACRDP8_20235 [Actinopolymorphaceae bacterium]